MTTALLIINVYVIYEQSSADAQGIIRVAKKCESKIMTGLSISVDDLEFFGAGLKRPECVLCTKAGAVFVSDWDGGVTRIDPDGGQTRILATPDSALRPNGIALSRDGGFLIAHLGEVLWKSGEREAAEALWERGLVDYPDSQPLIRTRQRFPL